MMDEPLEIRATASPWWRGVDILLRQGTAYGVKVLMEAKEPGVVVDPTVRISVDEAQTLMDDLWRCGLRPAEGAGSAGAMRAVERHVDDLRKIAFKAMDIPHA